MSSGHLKPLNRNNLIKNHTSKKCTHSKSKFLRHIYNSKKWKTLRNKYISDHPLCEICGAEATQVHHIIPFSTGKCKKDIEKLEKTFSMVFARSIYQLMKMVT